MKIRPIEGTTLWLRLEEEPLRDALRTLRANCAALAARVSALMPEYTDHSVRHMDALWSVADELLTPEELNRISPGEAFLLASSFYLHDIGMALAATEAGLGMVRDSVAYKSFLDSVRAGCVEGTWSRIERHSEAQALSYAVRKMHADAGARLATEPVPGTDTYLLEPRAIREQWGATIARVAASHHWNIDDIEARLGRQGIVPLANTGKGDPAYVACLLRLIDYAHINTDRASTVERAFRHKIDPVSLAHWLAQEHIHGPERVDNELVYRSDAAITSVDSWWLYYGMLSGLDDEIRAVRRYLDKREPSRGRLSLLGVRGAASPEECAQLIETGGFAPIEVNIRTASVERLLELLGGETLYGRSSLVPVRELVQNARDAVVLKQALAMNDYERSLASHPIRVRFTTQPHPTLEVVDHGIGMSHEVIKDYLVTIAADYWKSDRFFSEYPAAMERGFRPAGRFGIGFMSVFMLGDEVTVATNRDGGERFQLKLRGVGRRGDLRVSRAPPGSGTTVGIALREASSELLRDFPQLVRAAAPMLDSELVVEVDGTDTRIHPGWWKELPPEDLIASANDLAQRLVSDAGADPYYESAWRYFRWRRARRGDVPPAPWGEKWPEWVGDDWRLVAHPGMGMTVLCIHGIAVTPIVTPGFVGFYNSRRALTDVSRKTPADFDTKELDRSARAAVRPAIVSFLDQLDSRGFITEHTDFLETCMQLYGQEVVRDSRLRWISVVRPPADVETVTCQELMGRLERAGTVRISYGLGPWTAMGRWSEPAVNRGNHELALVLRKASGMHAPSYERDPKSGPLQELWPDFASCSTFDVVFALVAEAWRVTREELSLVPQQWNTQGGDIVGEIRRTR
jgi:histidine kinase/DNA gyrase B/HSP90-like ATPase